MRIRMVLAAATTLAALLCVPVFSSASAEAATPHCNDIAFFHSTWLPPDRILLPIYKATGSVTCTLSRGDHNIAVEVLQSALVDIYDQHITVDSDFGPATQQALKNVQAELRISADGIYGPQTRDHICWPDADYPGGCVWLNNNH